MCDPTKAACLAAMGAYLVTSLFSFAFFAYWTMRSISFSAFKGFQKEFQYFFVQRYAFKWG